MSGLLVSVRSAAEARVAMAGGAAVIDVKEPARGSLGRADDATIAAVVRTVAACLPVSAALGELIDAAPPPRCFGVGFVKWGLAGAARLDWRGQLGRGLELPGPQRVVVAYADWQCAQAPPIDEVVTFACERPGGALLVDTHCKDAAALSLGRRPTLLDWLAVADVVEICRRCREAHVLVALAGSLGPNEIETLLPARPNLFAVRGAVCDGSDRTATIDLGKVRDLTSLVMFSPGS
ncbi:MAG: (5-formylfuran-3-yl)methyl phosphate synthase [Gemmataceae bacterium]|nr:(5-formylfuran-3-yl)methyl phosphate synthase [Gemmataceae bacterium]